jgi:hypothetical protein
MRIFGESRTQWHDTKAYTFNFKSWVMGLDSIFRAFVCE